MNLISLSNLFRTVAASVNLRRYHYGFPQQFSWSGGGDLAGSNMQSEGQLYPALIVEPPRLVIPTLSDTPNAQIEFVFWFAAQLDADYNALTHLEQSNELLAQARQFFANLKEAGRLNPRLGMVGNLTMDTDFGVFLDRLVTIRVVANVQAALDCIPSNFNPADFPTQYPPQGTTDDERV